MARTRGLVVAALALVIWSVLDARTVAGARRDALDLTGSQGAAGPWEQRIRSEPDPVQATLYAGRALLSRALRPPLGVLSQEAQVTEARDRAELLDRSRLLAQQVVEERPSAAEAHLLLGASTYLTRSLRQDRTLFTDAEAWEAPLMRAADLEPANPEAERFLAMAYLEVWPMLSDQKRALARQLVGRAFEEPVTFSRFIGPWLLVHRDLDEALEALPSRPFVWRRMLQEMHARKDWPRYVRAQGELDEALAVEFEGKMRESAERASLGDDGRSRTLLIEVLGALPVDGRWASLFDRAMQALPPGPIHRVPAENVAAWLQWALQECTYRPCPLSPASILRAAVAAPELDDPSRAAALMAGEQPDRAFRIAGAGARGLPWDRYHLLHAQWRARRGEMSAARAALELVEAKGSGAAWHVAAALAELPAAQADQPLEPSWVTPEDHTYVQHHALAARTSSLSIQLRRVPPRGCPVEVLLDGERIARTVVRGPEAVLRHQLDLDAEPGHHELRLLSPAGCYFTPGRATWSPSATGVALGR